MRPEEDEDPFMELVAASSLRSGQTRGVFRLNRSQLAVLGAMDRYSDRTFGSGAVRLRGWQYLHLCGHGSPGGQRSSARFQAMGCLALKEALQAEHEVWGLLVAPLLVLQLDCRKSYMI